MSLFHTLLLTMKTMPVEEENRESTVGLVTKGERSRRRCTTAGLKKGKKLSFRSRVWKRGEERRLKELHQACSRLEGAFWRAGGVSGWRVGDGFGWLMRGRTGRQAGRDAREKIVTTTTRYSSSRYSSLACRHERRDETGRLTAGRPTQPTVHRCMSSVMMTEVPSPACDGGRSGLGWAGLRLQASKAKQLHTIHASQRGTLFRLWSRQSCALVDVYIRITTPPQQARRWLLGRSLLLFCTVMAPRASIYSVPSPTFAVTTGIRGSRPMQHRRDAIPLYTCQDPGARRQVDLRPHGVADLVMTHGSLLRSAPRSGSLRPLPLRTSLWRATTMGDDAAAGVACDVTYNTQAYCWWSTSTSMFENYLRACSDHRMDAMAWICSISAYRVAVKSKSATGGGPNRTCNRHRSAIAWCRRDGVLIGIIVEQRSAYICWLTTTNTRARPGRLLHPRASTLSR